MFDWANSGIKKLEDILVDSGKLSRSDMDKAINYQMEFGKKLEEILVEFDFISEEDLIEFLSEQMNVSKVNLSELDLPSDIVSRIPLEIAKKYNLIAFDEVEDKIYVAMSEPTNLLALDDIRFITHKTILPFIEKRDAISRAIEKYYSQNTSNQAIEELQEEYVVDMINEVSDDEVLQEVENAPTVRLTNSILTQGIEMKASDIHIEPFEEFTVVRYRIDGVLNEVMTIPRNLYPAVCTRLKIVAGMDIAEKRIPQDGRIQMKVNKIPYDFRISSLPTVYGEKIVIRILDRGSFLIERSQLGFTEEENNLISKMLGMPNGILLVTGPTGSGKTTTLYTFLNELNTVDKNITTIEDPVEYMLNRINQVHVNSKTGMTFASGLRSILRQDPDVIMIGEIRDEETGSIAVRASITGHFVLSTLHTNDASSTITRLIDMGLESYIVADAVVGIIAQRLVRRLCPSCKEMYEANEWEKRVLGSNCMLYRAKGCSKCNNTGYKGRVAVHEVLEVSKEISTIIEQKGTIEKIRQAAIANGMITLFENCKKLVEKGETTIDEMVKVVYERD